MSVTSSSDMSYPSRDGPVASIVGKWKDAHREKQASLLQMPENPLRRDRGATPDGGVRGGTPDDIVAISQTVAWMMQIMMGDRQQTQEWQNKIEKLLEKQQGQSYIDRALSANAQHIQSLVQDEIKDQRLWLTERFSKLAMLPKEHQGPVDAMDVVPQILEQDFNGLGSEADGLLSTSNNPDTVTGVVPIQMHTTPRSASMETLVGPSSHDVEQGASTSGVLRRMSGSSIQASCQRGIASETKRMNNHLERMRSTNKESHISLMLRDRLQITDEQWKNVKKKPSNRMIQVVESTWFATLSLTAVILNGIWIGYQTEASMIFLIDAESPKAPAWHQEVSRAFSVIFAVEIVLRLGTYRIFFFTCKDRAWNIYDLLVVLSAVAEEVFSTLNLKFLRTLRVFRLVRVTRVIRLLRFFQGIRYLICTLVACASMLFWTVVFLGFLIYIFAIVFMQSVTIGIDKEDTVLMKKIEQYYGSLATTMFTLMMVVTGGQPWDNFLNPLRDVSLALVPAFIAYVVISLYGILNIVTAVFVERAMELRERDRDLAVHKEMEDSEAFGNHLREFYEDEGLCQDDYMDWPTFQNILARKDVQMYLQTHGIDVSDAEELFLLIDVNRKGQIAVDDFVFGCQRLKGVAKGMDLVLLHDQVLQTQAHIRFVQDKQKVLQHQIDRMSNRISAELSSAIAVMKEVSADVYVQSQMLSSGRRANVREM